MGMKSKMTHDVPFGDKFLVQEKIELAPLDGAVGVKVRTSGRVVFLQSCGMLQSRIQTSVMSQLQVAGETFASQLKLRVSEDAGVRVEQVWELQRRITAWSRDWHAPFLPHDGRKRWRW